MKSKRVKRFVAGWWTDQNLDWLSTGGTVWVSPWTVWAVLVYNMEHGELVES